MEVMLISSLEYSVWSLCKIIALILSMAVVVLAACVTVYRHCTRHRNNRSQFHGLSRRMVKAMPSVTFTYAKEDNMTSSSCAICLEDYSVGDKLRVLPCSHKFHAACVDSWLTSWRTFCPVCKRDARTSEDESPPASETTPLLSSSIATSSVVFIDSSPLGSSVSFSPGHVSSSYIQQHIRSSSHHSWSSPISHVSADLRQQASLSLQSSSQRSYMSCIKSFHSLDYSTMSPGLVSSTDHRVHSLLSNHTASTFSPFASAHSFPDC